MSGEFDGKVAIVTGASSGIGRATALAFASRGANVVIGDVQEELGSVVVDEIKAAGGEASFRTTDVSQNRDVEALIAQAVERYGRLDYAFNNAGIEGTMAPTAECTEENWDRTIAINLKSVWLCMRHEIPEMLKQGSGAIVNNSSVAGLVGFQGLPAYCASKGGIVQLTKTAALEYAAAGIRVNAVCPGVIQTPMVDRIVAGDDEMRAQLVTMEPIGRVGRPEEIAESVLWLCSDKASFVTGQPLAVDGGFVAQ